jgi:hypothetical protein
LGLHVVMSADVEALCVTRNSGKTTPKVTV